IHPLCRAVHTSLWMRTIRQDLRFRRFFHVLQKSHFVQDAVLLLSFPRSLLLSEAGCHFPGEYNPHLPLLPEILSCCQRTDPASASTSLPLSALLTVRARPSLRQPSEPHPVIRWFLPSGCYIRPKR